MPAPDTDQSSDDTLANSTSCGTETVADMQSAPAAHSLFSVIGVELEYMIVDRQTMQISPHADRLLETAVGLPASDCERGIISWSNELPLHVIELKTAQPATTTTGLSLSFQSSVLEINQHLSSFSPELCLLPGGMHPWMNPTSETRLWPHECGQVYQAFHRIFDCSGHGWSNLQSTHINLPFANDDEFARLHAAVRLLLPLLPALAASSPVVDGRLTDQLDNRLWYYRRNSAAVPQVNGLVIPEPAVSEADYNRKILQPMYAAIQPLDPEGHLQHPFLNAHGAIARFDRGSIEIRLLDIQECPIADLAVVQLIVAVLQELTSERWSDQHQHNAVPTQQLAELLRQSTAAAEDTLITDPDLLSLFGYPHPSVRAGDLWKHLADCSTMGGSAEEASAISLILTEGSLASRLRRSVLATDMTRPALTAIWTELASCLQHNRMFRSHQL